MCALSCVNGFTVQRGLVDSYSVSVCSVNPVSVLTVYTYLSHRVKSKVIGAVLVMYSCSYVFLLLSTFLSNKGKMQLLL